jgi:hypothetical protein
VAVVVLAIAALCASVGFALGGGTPKAADPVPYPAALAGHQFAREFDPPELAGSSWTHPRNNPGGCAPNPAQVKLNGSGYAEVETNGQDSNCAAIQSPQTYATTDGYVYEADVYISTFESWPAFWMYGNNWPTGGEIDAVEANRNVNYVSWLYAPCNRSVDSSQRSTNPFSYNCKSDLTPTAGAPNLSAPAWHIVDIAFGHNQIEVFYDGKLYVTIPETVTSDTSDPMWVVFSDGSCAQSRSGHNICAPGVEGVGGNIQVKWLRIFT